MKHDDWQARLIAHLHTIKAKPFGPDHHCGLFAADCVLAMTGDDLAAKWRGCKTMSAGLKAIKRAGFADHIAVVAAAFDEVPVAFAQVGDVAVIPSPDGDALGIVQGANIYVLRPEGLGLVGLLSASRMFRVI